MYEIFMSDRFRIIIFGANGYIGRHLRLRCREYKHSYTLCDIQQESVDNDDKYVQIDITRKETYRELVKNHDILYLFSGKTGTVAGFQEYKDFIFVNELGLVNVLDVLKDSPDIKLVFPSTRLIYKGQEKDGLLHEDAAKETKTIYAVNKLACENYILAYHNMYNIPFTIFRICVPFGNEVDDKFSYGTIGMMIHQLKMNQEITIFGEGEQRRTLINISDLSRILLEVGIDKLADNKTYNIGGSEHISILEIAQQLVNAFSGTIKKKKWPKDFEKIESGSTAFDDSRLRKDFKLEYTTTFSNWLNSIKNEIF